MRPNRHLARAALVALLLSSGCRWLPMVRPSNAIDPRTLSNPGEMPPQPPALAVRTDGDETGVLPPLPEMQPVSAHLALAQTSSVVAQNDSQKKPPEPAPPVRLETPPDAPQHALHAPAEPIGQDRALDPELVRAAAADRGAPAAPELPEDLWRTGVERLLALARTQAVLEAKAGKDGGGVWWSREQVLDRLTIADGTRWQTLMDALAAQMANSAAQSPLPVDAAPAPAEGPPETTPPALQVTAFLLCRKIEGFGDYEPLDSSPLHPGDSIGLYWEVEGLQAKVEGDWHRSTLNSALELCAVGEEKPVWQTDLGTSHDECRRPRRDFFVNLRWSVPEGLKPGPYTLRVRVRDAVAGTEATRELALEIR